MKTTWRIASWQTTQQCGPEALTDFPSPSFLLLSVRLGLSTTVITGAGASSECSCDRPRTGVNILGAELVVTGSCSIIPAVGARSTAVSASDRGTLRGELEMDVATGDHARSTGVRASRCGILRGDSVVEVAAGKGSSIDLTTRSARCKELPDASPRGDICNLSPERENSVQAPGLDGQRCKRCGVTARGAEETRRRRRRCGVHGSLPWGADEVRRRSRGGGEPAVFAHRRGERICSLLPDGCL